MRAPCGRLGPPTSGALSDEVRESIKLLEARANSEEMKEELARQRQEM